MSSLWHETASLPSFPRLRENLKADVLIIGGGMAGLLTAYLLKEKGISSVILESGKICGGTTGNTTAKITFQHGLIYSDLIKKGEEKAKAYYEINRKALEKYRELSKSIKCDFETKDNYIYSVDDRRKIEDELNALRIIGAEGTLAEKLSLPFSAVGAVKTEKQAQFHPLLFASQIAKELNIYENSRVTEMKGNTAITEEGSVRAENVIVATHFPFINKHGLYSLKLYQHRSYVIALENAAEADGMYLDEKENGLSLRSYRNLLLMGGGDHRTGKKGGGYNELRKNAKKFYPGAQEKFHWATQDCISLDSMPYIGSYSESTHRLYTLTGFNKWGMTGSMAGADLLCDLVSGKTSPYAEIFSPSRSMLTPQLFINSAESLLGYLFPTVKRCPHLGCALRYNKAEHSWDCPCHGSRFTESGRVIDGPANGNLR
ncbi:MAG: FAD-dependent oxidoreductase [Clostridia bacterium]|nr:FAD-dependent oxidoreductase [Clostridia bacterium]